MATPVLVVDDSQLSRAIIVSNLPHEWEVDVRHAENGAAALAALRQVPAQVVFLDLTMPVMDGFQLLDALSREAARPVAIVISADIQPHSVRRALDLGAADFIEKPVTRDKIAAALKKAGVL